MAALQVKKEMEELEKAKPGDPKCSHARSEYFTDDICEKINEAISYAFFPVLI